MDFRAIRICEDCFGTGVRADLGHAPGEGAPTCDVMVYPACRGCQARGWYVPRPSTVIVTRTDRGHADDCPNMETHFPWVCPCRFRPLP